MSKAYVKPKVTRSEWWRQYKYRNAKSHGYLLKKDITNHVYKFCRTVLVFGLCFLIIQPLLNKISISFMLEKDLYDTTVVSIPRNFTLINYQRVIDVMDYWRSMLKTLLISLLSVCVQVMSCVLVGYGFARFNFPFKKFWFFCVILVIVVPPQTIMAPLYLNFRFFDILGIIRLIKGSTINMLSNIGPYVILCAGCMGLKSGLYIYLIRQFFRNVPKDIEEAAYVDGCGNLSTFIRVMLPDAKPIYTSCFLFAFVWQWTDAFYTNLFLGSYSLLPTAMAAIAERYDQRLKQITGIAFRSSIGYRNTLMATGVLLGILPLLLIYIVAQKGFVESLSQSGIKM